MEGGLLSLKWNNHRSTFFHVLSTVRKKESYCDVTLACDGKFYPVHKIVLATCSDYFEQIFERTSPMCKTPVIVLKDIRYQDLEALLNYMYVGEVNVLQTDLSGLIKAAECLRIKGLAVPDESPTENETFHENKRNIGWSSDEPESKRLRPDILSVPQRTPQSLSDNKSVRERDREISRPLVSYREPYREPPPRAREAISLPSPSSSPVPPSPETRTSNSGNVDSASEASKVTEESVAQDTGAKGSVLSGARSSEATDREEIVEDNVVKEEPQDDFSEAEETKESIRSVESEPSGISYPAPPGGEHSSSSVPGESESTGFIRTSQPQTMEDLVAHVLPGTSGLQGNSWEGERNLLGRPFEGYSGTQVRGSGGGAQMGSWTVPSGGGQAANQYGTDDNFLQQSVKFFCDQCSYSARDPANLRRHKRIHTGEKPYGCSYCPYKSNQSNNVKAHIKRLHSKEALSLQSEVRDEDLFQL